VQVSKKTGIPAFYLADAAPVKAEEDFQYTLHSAVKRAIVYRQDSMRMSFTVLLLEEDRALIVAHREHFQFGYIIACQAENAKDFVAQFFRRSLDMGPDVFNKTACTIPSFWEKLFEGTYPEGVHVIGRIRKKHGGVEVVPFSMTYLPGQGQTLRTGNKDSRKWDMKSFPEEALYTALRRGATKIISRRSKKKDQVK